MQMLIYMHIAMIVLAGIGFTANIFMENGKIQNLIEAIVWGVLAAFAVHFGGTFAFVMGIIFTVLLGCSTFAAFISKPKPEFFIHVPMFLLFLYAVYTYTY